MRKSKFSESQIVAILKEGEAGLPVAEVCRKHGISAPTYYAWKSKYAGATVSDLTRMRELEYVFTVRIHAPLLDTPTQPVNPLKPA